MKFKISDISKMTGISPSGIRFYEKAGVISPNRGKNQKYRDYSLHELNLLLLCRIYRDCGFTLPEAVDLLYCADIHQIKNCNEVQYAKLQQEIERKQILLETLAQRIKDIDCYQAEPPYYRFMDSPALLRLKVWQPGVNEKDNLIFLQVQEWMKYVPFVESCLTLSKENLCNGQGILQTEWGISIEERLAARLNFSPNFNVERIPSSYCLRVVINITEHLSISSDQLDGIRNYMARHNVEAAGPAISRLFIAEIDQNRILRHDFLWIPIQKKQPEQR